MKQKTLERIAKDIKQLEADIEKGINVEENQKRIESLMSRMTIEEMLQLDDYIFSI